MGYWIWVLSLNYFFISISHRLILVGRHLTSNIVTRLSKINKNYSLVFEEKIGKHIFEKLWWYFIKERNRRKFKFYDQPEMNRKKKKMNNFI